MGAPKGRPKTNNAVGLKGRAGRKSASVEAEKIIKYQAKKITDAMIVELATSRIYEALSSEVLNASEEGKAKVAQTFGMPIYLKNKADKIIYTEKAYDPEQRRRIAERIANPKR